MTSDFRSKLKNAIETAKSEIPNASLEPVASEMGEVNDQPRTYERDVERFANVELEPLSKEILSELSEQGFKCVGDEVSNANGTPPAFGRKITSGPSSQLALVVEYSTDSIRLLVWAVKDDTDEVYHNTKDTNAVALNSGKALEWFKGEAVKASRRWVSSGALVASSRVHTYGGEVKYQSPNP